jgi:radical SAM superfamily enzyme YgiQ (UPF0313 family)
MIDIELGPIRPPSESQSLLIRVTRGCHWNKCFFCGLYKGMKYSIRPTDDILEDIKKSAELYSKNHTVFTSCFLQDADALNVPTEDLLLILDKIKTNFPSLRTITSYARCDSILRKSESELTALRESGLNHLYRGIETGSDTILKNIYKGITSKDIIDSGLMCKNAGIILSDFTLLGIGGRELSKENAIETARVINAVNPEYIRVHHTAFKPNTKLGHDVEKGIFILQSEEEIVREQRLFIENLNGITSLYINEHIVNLLLEVRGRLPSAKNNMLETIDKYLGMPEDEKLNFAVGRRIGVYYLLSDMHDKSKNTAVSEYIDDLRAKHSNVDFDKVCNFCRANMI